MDTLVDRAIETLATTPLPLVLLIAVVFAAAEVSVGLGVLIPGETGVLALAALQTQWPKPVWLAVAVAAGGILGDSLGYLIGRRYGERLLQTRVGRRIGGAAWQRAAAALRRHGAVAVLGARYVAVLRAVVPVTAGAARLPYRRFLLASVVGATTWSVIHVALGVALGASFRQAARYLSTGGWVLFAVIAAAGIALMVHRRRRTTPSAAPQPDAADGDASAERETPVLARTGHPDR